MSEPLPKDLALLGAELERAAAASLARGRRRRAVARLAALVSIAVPVVLGGAAGPLAPSDGPMKVANPLRGIGDVQPGTAAVLVSHIPDEPLPAPLAPTCLDARDCLSPIPPSIEPAPPGRI